MAYGVTEEGFVLKRLEDILTEQRARASEIFKDLVPPGDSVDTSDSSVLGRLINLDSEGDAELWEAAQQVYSAMDPNTATGVALDNIVAYGGLSRLGETRSLATLLVEGDRGTSIPVSSVVQAPSIGVRFKTNRPVVLDMRNVSGISVEVAVVEEGAMYSITYVSDAAGADIIQYISAPGDTAEDILTALKNTIDAAHPRLSAILVDGTVLRIDIVDMFQETDFVLSGNMAALKIMKVVDASAEEPGPVEAVSNSITQIVSSILGWDSVTNPIPAVRGRFSETDQELRLRFERSKHTKGTNTFDAVLSSVTNIEGVTETKLYENEEDTEDANGLPPHSFRVVVAGGPQQHIAEAIWGNKPIGIKTTGGIMTQVLDSQGQPHKVFFSRPALVPIYVRIFITPFPDFPQDGVDMIRRAVADYKLKIAENVVHSRLYSPINSIPGHQVDLLEIGTSPDSLAPTNITMGFDQLATFILANIEVVV